MSARRAGALLTVLALVCGGCFGSAGQPAGVRSGSTLVGTWADPDGDGALQPGPGEPLRDRTALAPARRRLRRLAVFAQIADAHVTDEESPARVEMLDRLGAPYDSAFRPQEALTTQTLAAVCASLDTLPLDAVVETGDLVDNAQANEFAQAFAVLGGGRVDPDSGARGYDGVQAARNPDPLIYRPALDPPRHPALLQRAEQPFTSPGLRAPWYPLPGNHDLLVQGNLRATPGTEAAAIGDRKLLALDPEALRLARRRRLAPAAVEALLAQGLPGRTTAVPADPARRELLPAEAVARLRQASGHGGTGPRMDDVVDLGSSVRLVLLDTTARAGGAAGGLERSQVRWLASALAGAGRRWVVVFSSTPLDRTVGGDRALALLDRDPRVVAAVAGDTHRNRIAPRRTPAGGYWLVTTSSLADYPQQARAFAVVATAGGGVALETWMVGADPRSRLAAISRQLAFLDYQGGRPRGFAGTRLDRNVRLFVGAPGG